MNPIRTVLVEWNGLVSLVSVGLAYSTCRLLGRPVDAGVLSLLAAGAWLVYGLDRRLPFSPEDRLVRVPPRGPPRCSLWVAGGIGLVAVAGMDRAAQGLAMALGCVSAAYILPVLPGGRRLKDVPYLKCVLVASGWSLATVALPVIQSGLPAATNRFLVPGLLLYRLVWFLPNLLLADWPDRAADRRVGIRTVANRVDERTLRRVVRGASASAGIGGLFVLAALPVPSWFAAELLLPAGWWALLRKPLPDGGRFYTVVIDAALLWPAALALLVGRFYLLTQCVGP